MRTASIESGKIRTFDEFGTYPVSVIRDGDEIRAYYAGWTRCESCRLMRPLAWLSAATAVRLSAAGDGPVLSYSRMNRFARQSAHPQL